MGSIVKWAVQAVALAVAAATATAGAALFRPDLFSMIAAMRLPPDGVWPVALFLFGAAYFLAVAALRPFASSGFRWIRLPLEFVTATILIPVPLLEIMLAWRAFGTPAEGSVGLIAIPCALTWLIIFVRWGRRETDDERILRGAPELPGNPLLANLSIVGLLVLGIVYLFTYSLVLAGADFYLESILFDHVMPTLGQLRTNLFPGPGGWNALYSTLEIYGGYVLFVLVMAFVSAWQARPRDSGAKRFDR